MDDPLKTPIPESQLTRAQAYARDLAYGVAMGYWSADFLVSPRSGSGDEWSLSGKPEFLDQLTEKWGQAIPSATLLLLFGYIQLFERKQYSDLYLLTPKSFELLEHRPDASIFISYKRAESSAFALLILARLKTALGSEPFLDMSIEPGDDWEDRLRDEIDRCDSFIAVVGPKTLESNQVRQEIEWAIQGEKTVIPIWHNNYSQALNQEFQEKYPELGRFFVKNAILVEKENPVGYEGALIQLLNRFGVTPR